MINVGEVDNLLSMYTHVSLGKQLKVGHKVVPWSDVFQCSEYFTRVGPRLLYIFEDPNIFICTSAGQFLSL